MIGTRKWILSALALLSLTTCSRPDLPVTEWTAPDEVWVAVIDSGKTPTVTMQTRLGEDGRASFEGIPFVKPGDADKQKIFSSMNADWPATAWGTGIHMPSRAVFKAYEVPQYILAVRNNKEEPVTYWIMGVESKDNMNPVVCRFLVEAVVPKRFRTEK